MFEQERVFSAISSYLGKFSHVELQNDLRAGTMTVLFNSHVPSEGPLVRLKIYGTRNVELTLNPAVTWRNFRRVAQVYSQALVILMMQSTACMALHSVQERCCRWLLMTHDRVRRDDFQLSHEFLAMMLGSTRPTVTIVAGALQKAGLIKYTHGRMRIVNRPRLEKASCECYATVKDQFDRLGL